jgi:hypothetical protein
MSRAAVTTTVYKEQEKKFLRKENIQDRHPPVTVQLELPRLACDGSDSIAGSFNRPVLRTGTKPRSHTRRRCLIYVKEVESMHRRFMAAVLKPAKYQVPKSAALASNSL